jgi:hypothetical protein
MEEPEPHPDHELFAGLAAELVHLDNGEARRTTRDRWKPTAQLIWAERNRQRRAHPQYWRRQPRVVSHPSRWTRS